MTKYIFVTIMPSQPRNSTGYDMSPKLSWSWFCENEGSWVGNL